MKMYRNSLKIAAVLACAVLFSVIASPAEGDSTCSNSLNQQSATALHEAASRGDAVRIKELIGAGFDVDNSEEICRSHAQGLHCQPTPLHLAVCSGNIDAVKALLDAGFDVDAKYKMTYERYEKIYKQQGTGAVEEPSILLYLSKIAHHYYQRSTAGTTCCLARRGLKPLSTEEGLKLQSRLIELLLESGADPNYPSFSPLYRPPLLWILGPQWDREKPLNMDTARLLLEHGADPKVAFEYAKERNDKEALELLAPFCRDSGRC